MVCGVVVLSGVVAIVGGPADGGCVAVQVPVPATGPPVTAVRSAGAPVWMGMLKP